jgi:hypothetical protein
MAQTAPVKMYDSATPDDIPTSAQVVAGYIDGDYAWSSEDWKRFPDADKVLITVTGSLNANVIDVENGDMDPVQAMQWIRSKQQAGMRGCTVYCTRSSLDSVWSACRGHAYYVWVADWTDAAHAVGGTVATQYSNVGNSYDLSMVYSQEWLEAIAAANNPWPLH